MANRNAQKENEVWQGLNQGLLQAPMRELS